MTAMMPEQMELWNKIHAFELDDPESAYSFSDRLARENGWSKEYTLRTIHEYKKFMFLLCLASPLTPSDQVDQVWHLHLLYTRSYWEDFCRDTLGQSIHHGPTRGGMKEEERYHDYYETTKKKYLQLFGQAAPEDIWPESGKRFSDTRFQRVNLARHWVIKKIFPWKR